MEEEAECVALAQTTSHILGIPRANIYIQILLNSKTSFLSTQVCAWIKGHFTERITEKFRLQVYILFFILNFPLTFNFLEIWLCNIWFI